MSGVNKCILVGFLGKDPEVKRLDNDRAVCNFSLATSESYKNKQGEKVTNTEWHNIVLWSPLAEIAEKYLKKGNQVYIEGKLTTRNWDDQQGNKRYTTEVVGRELTLLGNKDNQPVQSQSTEQPAAAIPEDDTNDLPF